MGKRQSTLPKTARKLDEERIERGNANRNWDTTQHRQRVRSIERLLYVGRMKNEEVWGREKSEGQGEKKVRGKVRK